MPRGSSGGVRVEGLNRLTRDLQALGLDVDDLKQAFGAVADRGARVAAGFAPRLSGALAGDIRGNRAKNKAVITAGRARIPYAGVIEHGWRAHGIAASSYMQRADRALQPYTVQQINQELQQQIRRRGLA